MSQRLITGLTFAISIIAAILYMPHSAFIVTLLLIISVGFGEWTQFLSWPKIPSMIAFLAITILFFLGSDLSNIDFFMFKNKQELYQIIWPLFIACLFWGSISILVITHPRYQSKWEHNDLLKFLFGLLTLLPFLISVMLLRYMPLSSCAESSFFCNSTEHNSFHGTLILLLGCLIVWIADSGAYYGGRRFGKHKLAPKVSPNKTVEGVISGMLASFIVAVLFTQLIGLTEFNMFNLLIICVITVPVSVLGDLSESMLKRVAGIKDSGQFLPGHGGILDRIDGLSAALPIYALLYFTLVY